MKRYNPIVVAYDITSDKTRRKVYKTLKAWRLDGQKSVHECQLRNAEAEDLFLQINDSLNQDTDSLMMAWLEGHRRVLHRGLGRDVITKEMWR